MTWNDHPSLPPPRFRFSFTLPFFGSSPPHHLPGGWKGQGSLSVLRLCSSLPRAASPIGHQEARGGAIPGPGGWGRLEGHASGRASPGRRRLDLPYYWTPGSRLFRPTHEEA